MSLQILLVEDDRELRATLRDALTLEGYEIITAVSVTEVLRIIEAKAMKAENFFDLVLLDLGLPDAEGDQLLLSLRKKNKAPVIIISAQGFETKKIQLLDLGADDYLVKPFGIGELLARIRVALRHKGFNLNASVTRYETDDLVIDLPSRKVERNEEEVHLTPTEFNLLACLVRNAGRVVTHRQLLKDVWGAEYIDRTEYLRLYMAQLRAKLESRPAEPKLLLTEPGVGYRLMTNNN